MHVWPRETKGGALLHSAKHRAPGALHSGRGLGRSGSKGMNGLRPVSKGLDYICGMWRGFRSLRTEEGESASAARTGEVRPSRIRLSDVLSGDTWCYFCY